jgi:hypothetical protein
VLAWARKLFDLRAGDGRVLRVLAPLFALVTAANVVTVSFSKALYLHYNPFTSLPWMYIGGATFTVLASLAYVNFIGRYSMARRFEALLLLCVVSFAALGVLALDPEAAAGLSLPIYVWSTGTTQLVLIQAWGFSTALLPVRQARRLFPVLAASATLGAALGGLLTSGLLAVGPLIWLIFATVAILGGGVACVRVATRVFHDETGKPGREPGPNRALRTDRAPEAQKGIASGLLLALRSLREVPLLRLLALLTFVVQGASTVLDYQFSAALKAGYAAEEIAGFLGVYYAVANSLSMLLALTAGQRISRWLGIGVAASATGFALALGGGVATGLLVAGFAQEGVAIAIIVTSMAERVVSFGITKHAQNASMSPIDGRIAERSRFLIDGVGHKLATVLVSLAFLLSGLDLGDFGSFSPFVLVVALFAVAVGLSLGPTYRRALVDGLRERRVDTIDTARVREWAERDAQAGLRELLASPNPQTVLEGLALMAELGVTPLRSRIRELLGHSDTRVQARALHVLATIGEPVDEAELRRFLAESSPVPLLLGAMRHATSSMHSLLEPIQALLEHAHPLVKCLALIWLRARPEYRESATRTAGKGKRQLRWTYIVRALGSKHDTGQDIDPAVQPDPKDPVSDTVTELLGYLRHLPAQLTADSVTERQEALDAMAVLRLPELVPPLLDALEDPGLRETALATLKQIGPELVLPVVEIRLQALGFLSRAARVRLLRVAEVLQATSVLEKHAGSTDRNMRNFAAGALWRLASDPQLPVPDEEVLVARLGPELRALQGYARLDPVLRTKKGKHMAVFRDEIGLVRAAAEVRVFRLLGVLGPRQPLHRAFLHYRSPDPRTRSTAIELIDASLKHPELRTFVQYVEATEHRRGRSFTAASQAADYEFLLGRPQENRQGDPVEGLLPEVDDKLLSLYRWAVSADAEAQVAGKQRRFTTTGGIRPVTRDLPGLTSSKDSMDRVFLLRSIPLFEGIPADQLLAVADIAAEVGFEARDVIFREGDPGDHLYLIVHGRVNIVHGQSILAELGPGECFGEMALLDQSPRSAMAVAATDLDCMVLARDDFEDLLELSPSLAKGIIRVLTQRLRSILAGHAQKPAPADGQPARASGE